MHDVPPTDFASQNRLIRALLEKLRSQTTSRGVRLVETHISWVLLAGSYAYKIKKAVDLGFLNFRTLEQRQYYCAEEIRLNRRLAPQIYLNVIPIGGNVEAPVLEGQPAIEFAVRMRRFAASMQLDRLLLRNKILPRHIDSLAETIAHFHGSLPAADKDSSYGTAEAVHLAAEQNFEQLRVLLTQDADSLMALRKSFDREFAACSSLFAQRLERGFVRECHGDLHLGNIVLIAGQPVPFDGIEFNPALRWIDVTSEIAFTVMDLLHLQRADLAWRFLNAWLAATGDYAGMALLRFYIAYRAMVRAKVSAIRAAQHGLSTAAVAEALGSCRGYLDLAAAGLAGKQAALIITHGLPGSGKSTFAQIALEQMQAIRLRSDVERKRMFGLSSLASSRNSIGIDLYRAEITQRTYARLRELARELLLAGFRVIVDAAFLDRDERAQFQQLAHELSVPFALASMQASKETLRERIMRRQRAANDASEADIAVLEKLQLGHHPLSAEEQSYAAVFVAERGSFAEDSAGWSRLQQLLGRNCNADQQPG